MKISKTRLKEIIKEELSSVLKENSREELLDAIKQTYTRIETVQPGSAAGGIPAFMERIAGLPEEILQQFLQAGHKFLAKKTGLPV
jgi:hypothetical protein